MDHDSAFLSNRTNNFVEKYKNMGFCVISVKYMVHIYIYILNSNQIHLRALIISQYILFYNFGSVSAIIGKYNESDYTIHMSKHDH